MKKCEQPLKKKTAHQCHSVLWIKENWLSGDGDAFIIIFLENRKVTALKSFVMFKYSLTIKMSSNRTIKCYFSLYFLCRQTEQILIFCWTIQSICPTNFLKFFSLTWLSILTLKRTHFSLKKFVDEKVTFCRILPILLDLNIFADTSKAASNERPNDEKFVKNL